MSGRAENPLPPNERTPCLGLRFRARLVEHFLNAEFEGGSDPERQRQRRIESAVLDGVDGIARNPDAVRELSLTPALFGAKHTDAVFHGAVRPHITTALPFLPCVAAR